MTKSASAPLPASVLEALARYDTPTICNAMEIVAPERRLIGYTTKPLVCPFPEPAADGRLCAHGDDPLGAASPALPPTSSRSGGSPITNMSAPALVRASP